MKNIFKILILVVSMLLSSASMANVVNIHYHRFNGDYTDWKLWVWNSSDNKPGKDILPEGEDNFGIVFHLDINKLKGKNIGIIPKYKNWESKDGGDKIFKEDGSKDIYIVQGEPAIYSSIPDLKPKVVKAVIDSRKEFSLIFSHAINKDTLKNISFLFDRNGRKMSIEPVSTITSKSIKFNIKEVANTDFIDINRGLWKVYIDDDERILKLGKILDDPYFYFEGEMGVSFHEGKTIIRVFAPTSVNTEILFCNSPGKNIEEVKMDDIGHGIWEKIFPIRLNRVYYKFKVYRDGKEFIGLDPYSKCNTSHDGWGYIYDDKCKVFLGPDFTKDKAIIYELHIRDFTIDKNSGIKNRGKFLGLCEENTEYNGVKTGLSHLVELGVNTIQLMPIQDFENNEHSEEYNWGYMPVNFFSPDGWYATKTNDESRVIEFHKLVNTLHKNGMKIIMDVVYNHTAENSDSKRFSFNAIVDGYYYRLHENGSFWNGSGCGNEFRSESPMGRKFIIDSLKYWVKCYGIDGFRFDLMGLIDLDTLKQAISELKKIKPQIMIYGEPWTAGDTPINKTEKGAQKGLGFSVFNDHIRDAINGSVWNLDPGYIENNGELKEKVVQGMKGSIDDFCISPLESINYVTCHDNLTLWDRINLCMKDVSYEKKKSMQKLALGIILTSQGIPFIHSGAEFLRSKGGEHNSYNLPDSVNEIDWSLKKKNWDVFKFVKKMISLRKEFPQLRIKDDSEIREKVHFYDSGDEKTKNCIIIYLDKKLLILINPYDSKVKLNIPDGEFSLLVDSSVNVEKVRIFKKNAELKPISMIIMERK